MLQDFRERKEEWIQKESQDKTQVVIWKMTVTGEEVGRGSLWRETNLSKDGICSWVEFVHGPFLSFFFSFPLIWYQFLVPSNFGPFFRLATTLLGCTHHTLDHLPAAPRVCSSEAQLMLLPINCGQDLICIGFQVGESSSLKRGKRSKVRQKELKSTVNQWGTFSFSS